MVKCQALEIRARCQEGRHCSCGWIAARQYMAELSLAKALRPSSEKPFWQYRLATEQ
jgi:hypothetical protein